MSDLTKLSVAQCAELLNGKQIRSAELCQAFIDPGDVILVEAPTFVQSVEIFDMFEARCVSVAMDDDGLIPEDLERKLRENRPKMLYTIPTFQNPSGRTLSLERRRAVAELAERYDVLVLEENGCEDLTQSPKNLIVL